MIAKLPKPIGTPEKSKMKTNFSEEDTNEEIARETLTPKKKSKKIVSKKSPKKSKKLNLKVCNADTLINLQLLF